MQVQQALPLIAHLGNVVLIWSVLAVSLNLLQGTSGLFNLGHAGFFCAGAYAAALLAKAGAPTIVCIAASALVPSLIALVYGLPTLRLRADYFSTVTMGLGEIVRAIVLNWQSLTGGPDGVRQIPSPVLFGLAIRRGSGTIVLNAVILLLSYVALERWRRSGFGRTLIAAREDPTAAQAMGKDIYRTRLSAFLISAALAGIAGSMFAYYYGYINPMDFQLWVTFNLVLTVTMGGLGSFRGSIVAAAAFILLRDGFRFLPLPASGQGALQQLLFGVLLIIIMLRFPQGLLPETPTVTLSETKRHQSKQA